MTELRFFLHATLVPPSPGWALVAASINDEDECLCLWSAGGKHRITRGSKAAADGCEVDVFGVRYPAVGQLLDGGFLITDTRMRVDRRTGKRLPVSSWTFSSSGQRTGEGSLGDGIQQMLTTPKGDIWVNIVQVRGGTLSSWDGAPAGAHGLLVSGDRCVLVGGCQEARDRVTHLQLTSEGLLDPDEVCRCRRRSSSGQGPEKGPSGG